MSRQNHFRRRDFLQTMGVAGAGLILNSHALAEPPVQLVPRRKFGRHDEMVSSLGIGGHTLALAASVAEATRIAHQAIDCGATFFDNAWEYHGGRGEEWMGKALAGKRDRVFLMTKVCTHLPGRQSKEQALAMLEESLTRLQTDHLDLWQIHQVGLETEADAIFKPGGVLEAIELARKQGKIRYCGFTGHYSPQIHLRVLAHKYPFDAVQMPLSVFDAHADGFQKLVLPELVKQGIAPLAMKSLGGNGRSVGDGVVTAAEALRYTLSLPITTLISGMDSMSQLRQNAGVAANFQPMSHEEMAALEQRCADKNHYEPYRHWAYLDGHARFSGLA
jgi:uncharacterized protein